MTRKLRGAASSVPLPADAGPAAENPPGTPLTARSGKAATIAADLDPRPAPAGGATPAHLLAGSGPNVWGNTAGLVSTPPGTDAQGVPTSASRAQSLQGAGGALASTGAPSASPEQVAAHRRFMALFAPRSVEMDGWPVSPIVYGATAPSRLVEHLAHFAGALVASAVVAAVLYLLFILPRP